MITKKNSYEICILLTAPPGPPIPKVIDCTKSTVELEWIPPLIDGGSKVTGYFVEYKEEGKEEWEKVVKYTIQAYDYKSSKYLLKVYKHLYFLLVKFYFSL